MQLRGPYGVGVGLQAKEVVADAAVTQSQSARGRLACRVAFRWETAIGGLRKQGTPM